jgi:uroporphyrin-III C-methyltransferase
MRGKVYLVGAGPGDPELLTLKTLRLLRTADAVLHDDLVAPEILQLIPSTAQIHNVGKRCGKKKILQGEINCLMVALAASGLRVLRLKGGDPLIFGRAGEEIQALRANNISFEIVPGVTSAMGAAAAAQIPLTHRRASSALVFITAHESPEKRSSKRSSEKQSSRDRLSQIHATEKDALDWSNEDALDWSKLVGSGATLVIYMPGKNYTAIAQRLRSAGLTAETPCAIVSRASTPFQRTHRTTVLDLHRAPQLASPTLLIVGEVVGLADPVAISEQFIVRDWSGAKDISLPAAWFESNFSHTPFFGADEEPIS